MGYLTYTEKLKDLEFYIRSNMAVSVDTLVKKLNVSRRTVLRMIETLKEQGKDVKYCKKLKSYYFEEKSSSR